MGTKDQLLALFENNKGTFFSGEEIAEKLSISRAAVWKAVKSLRGDGYDIYAVPNKGYRLAVETDIISIQGIRRYLQPVCAGMELELIPSVPSTNDRVREKAIAGAPEGYTVLALRQTGGKGRRGRSFYSPPDTGIYMSLLLRPQRCTAQEAAQFTTMAAVAACEAIEKVSGEEAQIKWVNDIYIAGKKVSGILTEASVSLENGFVEYAVLGIGINVLPPEGGFPADIENVAGAVFSASQSDGKNRLAAEFLSGFMTYYFTPSQRDLLIEKYRKRCFVIGRTIQVLSADSRRTATALGIDENYRLLVEYEDGERESLFSGEISVAVTK